MNRQILRLAIPNIISNLTVPLLSMVDTALMGRLTETYFLGAVAVGSAMFSFVYWGFGFLRMSTTGLTAQAYGSGNRKACEQILKRALFVGFVAAVLLIIFQYPLAKLALYLINASPEVETHAVQYFYIRMFAAPATLGSFALIGWFLGMQNARLPLYLTATSNLANIVFSIYFVKYANMNVTGVALGTVCAQYLSIILGIWFLHKEFRVHMFQFNLSELLEPKSLQKFLSVNRDIFIRTMTLVFSLAFFTAQSAKFGDSLLAVNTILLQLILVLSYGIDGFAYAAESLTGKYIGAKRNAELRRLIRYLFYWSLGLGVVVALGYFAFYDRLFLIFTNKNELLQLSYDYKLWLVAAPIINGFSYIWDGIYIGAADGKALRNAMLFCTFVIYLPTYYLLGSFWGNQALWLAFTLFMISRGATLWWYAGYRIKVWLTA